MRSMVLGFLVVAACAPIPSSNLGALSSGEGRPTLSASQVSQERAVARSLFTRLQPISIAEGVEYCGLIGLDAAGNMVATQPERGRPDSCLIESQGQIEVVTASYHTHGSYSPDFFDEIPSDTDVEGDEADGIDGYVATPGGRFWYIDSSERFLRQLCSPGCLPRDPRFVPDPADDIALTYTYEQLFATLAQ